MRNKIEVIWSLESAKRTEEIVKYISENWADKEVLNFLTDLKSFEEIVSYFPEIYPESQIKKGYRRAVINKQTSVIYSIEKNLILVHTLFDNRQDPKKLGK
jgi:plasmid stabilization system protein ParE